MPQLLNPLDFATRLHQGETRDQILLDASGHLKAKLAGVAASVEIAAEDRAVDFVISTGALDRYNSTIAPKGWKIDNFQRNPVVLWAHDDSIPAIGRAENTKVAGDVRSRAVFADRDTHPLADTVYRLIKGGFINGASVGWIPLKWQFVEEEGRGFGIDYLEQELLEWSVVNIPANPECLVGARSMGIDTKPLLLWAERTLDVNKPGHNPDELMRLREYAGAPHLSPPAGRGRRAAAGEGGSQRAVLAERPSPLPLPQAGEGANQRGSDMDSFTAATDAAKTLLRTGSIDINQFAELITSSARNLLSRAGRVLSEDNETKLRKAHEHCLAAADSCRAACDHIMAVVEQNKDSMDEDPVDADPDQDPERPSGDDDNDPDDPDKSRRARRIRLLKLSASSLAIAAVAKPAA